MQIVALVNELKGGPGLVPTPALAQKLAQRLAQAAHTAAKDPNLRCAGAYPGQRSSNIGYVRSPWLPMQSTGWGLTMVRVCSRPACLFVPVVRCSFSLLHSQSCASWNFLVFFPLLACF